MAIHAAVELIADRSPDAWFAKIQADESRLRRGHTSRSRINLKCIIDTRMRSPTTARRLRPSRSLWAAHSALGIDLMRLGQARGAIQGAGTELTTMAIAMRRRSNSLKPAGQLQELRHLPRHTTIIKLNKTEVRATASVLAGGAAHDSRHLLEEVPDDASRPRAGGGLSEPRGLCGAHHGHAGPGRAGRDFRPSGGHGQPLRAQARGLQLGRDAMARDEPRLHSYGDQSSRAALVHRRAGGARGGPALAGVEEPRYAGRADRGIRDKKLLPVASWIAALSIPNIRRR